MKCRELMKTKVERVDAEDSVLAAAERMRTFDLGFLPVCDGAGKPVGAITDRDIVLRCVAPQKPLTTRVSDVMTRDVVFCRPDADLREAEVVMVTAQKSRLMVVDEHGVLVGVISLSDIAGHETSRRTAKTLEGVTRREARP